MRHTEWVDQSVELTVEIEKVLAGKPLNVVFAALAACLGHATSTIDRVEAATMIRACVKLAIDRDAKMREERDAKR